MTIVKVYTAIAARAGKILAAKERKLTAIDFKPDYLTDLSLVNGKLTGTLKGGGCGKGCAGCECSSEALGQHAAEFFAEKNGVDLVRSRRILPHGVVTLTAALDIFLDEVRATVFGWDDRGVPILWEARHHLRPHYPDRVEHLVTKVLTDLADRVYADASLEPIKISAIGINATGCCASSLAYIDLSSQPLPVYLFELLGMRLEGRKGIKPLTVKDLGRRLGRSTVYTMQRAMFDPWPDEINRAAEADRDLVNQVEVAKAALILFQQGSGRK